MSRIGRRYVVLSVIGLVRAGLTAVAWLRFSPRAQEARHLRRGETYFAQAQFREAIIEYQNVLWIDSRNARAIRQLRPGPLSAR